MKKVLTLFMMLGLFLHQFHLNAQILQSCDQWANTSVNGYNIYNNIWGANSGSQCMTAYAEDDWYVDANHTGGGIKSYPNSEKQLSVNVDNMGQISSSFNVSRPSGGSYSSAYDIWYDNYAYEIMLWMNYTGSVGPISYNYGCNGYPSTACPEATNVNVGGHTWNIYRGNNGGNEVFSFLRTSNTNSGTVDITAISQWLRNNGWFGNANLHSIQFGFEITNTSGTQRFEINDFSVNTGSGGGSSTYVQFRNRNTGLYLDGMGRTTNGAAVGQYGNTSHVNSQWELVSQGGNYYQLRNRGTGLYLDGMGRTTNGSDCGQWSNTTHYNSHWELLQYSGNYYRLRNRTTGLYLDGMGRTSNGSNCGQWSNTTHPNAQWEMINSSGSREDLSIVAMDAKNEPILLYPNPAQHDIHLNLGESSFQKLEVIDMTGRKISDQVIESNVVDLNITNLQSGHYMIRLSGQDGTITKRFLKQD